MEHNILGRWEDCWCYRGENEEHRLAYKPTGKGFIALKNLGKSKAKATYNRFLPSFLRTRNHDIPIIDDMTDFME